MHLLSVDCAIIIHRPEMFVKHIFVDSEMFVDVAMFLWYDGIV